MMYFHTHKNQHKGGEKIRKQTITKENNLNFITENKAKIIIPLLLLTLALVLSFSVNDAAAANGTSNAIVPSHNIKVSNLGQVANTQTTVQSNQKLTPQKLIMLQNL